MYLVITQKYNNLILQNSLFYYLSKYSNLDTESFDYIDVNKPKKLSPLCVQLMHTIYYKIVKQLKSFKIIIVTLTCFGLHKPSSGNSLPLVTLAKHRQRSS